MNKRIIIIPFLAVLAIAAVLLAFPSTVFSPEFRTSQEELETKKPTASEPIFDKEKYSLTDPGSPWIIASKVSPLDPIDYTPNDLVDVGNGQLLRNNAAKAFLKMQSEARKSIFELLPLSGYRSYQNQQAVYASEVNRFGQETADTQSARPGHSEHQTGLGIDIGGGGCGIEDCFGDTAEYAWLKKNAYKYGFIQRYTEGKQDITGYRTEPWHWRYVGIELATEMHKQSIETLEEFFGVVPNAQPW